jgi:RNA polymerase sigma-70 factor, ECF subfamily
MNPSVENSEDRRALSLIASGDSRAFRAVVDAHAGPLLTFVTRILGSQAEGEEIVQEVFVRVWQKAEKYNGSARATTWLHRIAHNLAIDALRKRKSQHLAQPSTHRKPGGEGALELENAPDSERPNHLLERKQELTSLTEAMANLPERQKMALLLRYEQGLKEAEVAEVLGLSVDASESLLARARRALRDQLGDRS